MEAISVGAFVAILNETLGFAYPEVTIEGEVSGYKENQGKWVFFDIKDKEASLPCFIPLYQLNVPIEDGMRVLVTGSPKLLKWGKFSFTVKALELAGVGELQRALEILKAKLETEGLFDPSRKRQLPAYPRRIGLVTSGTSAAYHDFMKILDQRWGGVEVLLADSLVQGQAAPESLVTALGTLNQLSDPVDVIVMIRGGGSLEDLAAFSTEPVVRAVAASRTPVVVGVGHEVDTSLSDLAADVRATTPTNAAQLVVPDRHEVLTRVGHRETQIENRLKHQLAAAGHHLEQAQGRLLRFIEMPRRLVDRQQHIIMGYYLSRVAEVKTQITSLGRLLANLDPQATLKRGYAIVHHEGLVLRSAAKPKAGDELMIQLAQGKLGAKVNDK